MAYHDFDGLSAGSAQSGAQHLQIDAQNQVGLPDSSYVRDASLTRDGMDLVLDGPQGTIVIDSYYASAEPPLLTAPDGASLTPALVNSFVQHSPHYAQAATMTDVSPVGVVEEINGEATVTHPNGLTEVLSLGAPIYQGDIIETGASGAVNIHFVDDTSFAVSEEARLAIDEYVFDPATQSGEQNFSVIKGMFVFTSGLIGREDPDDVHIETPTGSIGIRGTIIAGDVDSGDVTVVEGAIVVRDLSGNEITLANQFETARIAPGQPLQHIGQLSASDVAARFVNVSNVSPTLFSSINDAAAEQNPAPVSASPEATEDAPAQQESPANANGSVDQNSDNQVDGTIQQNGETADPDAAPSSPEEGANLEGTEQNIETANTEIEQGFQSNTLNPEQNALSQSNANVNIQAQNPAATTSPKSAVQLNPAKIAAMKAAIAAHEAASTETTTTQSTTQQPPPSVLNPGTNPTTTDRAPSGVDRNIAATEDTAHSFGPLQFQYTDPDGDTLTAVRIATLPSPSTGTLYLDNTAVSAGQIIPVTQLSLLSFMPAADYNGPASFTYSVRTSGGSFDPTPNTMTLNIAGVNDAPTSADGTITLDENTAHSFEISDFAFNDVDAGDALGAIVITNLALDTDSTLQLNGVNVTNGQTISAGDLANLVFTPGANESGSGYAAFTYAVIDSHGAQSASTYTMTFDVTDVYSPLAFNGFNAGNFLENAINTAADHLDPDGFTLAGSAPASFDEYMLIVSTDGGHQDVLGILTGNGITVSGNTINYGTQIATFTGGAQGQPLQITFTANATLAGINALMSQLSYQNLSDLPEYAHQIEITFYDNYENILTETSGTLTVTAQNDVPVALASLSDTDPRVTQSNIAPDDYFRAGGGRTWSYHFNREFIDSDHQNLTYELHDTANGSVSGAIDYLNGMTGTILTSGSGDGYRYDSNNDGIADTVMAGTAGMGWSYDETTGLLTLNTLSAFNSAQNISFEITAIDGDTASASHTYTITGASSAYDNAQIGTTGSDVFTLGTSALSTGATIFAGLGDDTIALDPGNAYAVHGNYINLGNGMNTVLLGNNAYDNTIIGGFERDTITVQNAQNKISTMDGDDLVTIDLDNTDFSSSMSGSYIYMGDSGFAMGAQLRALGLSNYQHGGGTGAGDTLSFMSSGASTIDFTNIDDNYFRGIERIQLAGTPNQTVILSYNDVIQMTDYKNTLIFRGDGGDTVNFAFTTQQLESFTYAGTMNNVDDDYTGSGSDIQSFDVFTNGEVTLLVDTDINTTGLVA